MTWVIVDFVLTIFNNRVMLIMLKNLVKLIFVIFLEINKLYNCFNEIIITRSLIFLPSIPEWNKQITLQIKVTKK